VNKDSRLWNISTAKVMSKKLLSSHHATHIASLIIDRKLSRIPLAMRFKTTGPQGRLSENSLFEAIENIEMTKRDLFRDFAFVFFLISNLFLSLVLNCSKRDKSHNDLSLVYSLTPEQILHNGETDAIEEFMKEPRFAALFCERTIVVESRKLSQFWSQENYGNLRIVFDNSLWVTRNRLSRKTVVKIFRESICILIGVLFQKNHDYQFTLRELIFDEPIWRHYLQQAEQINVITTQSQFLRLPYIFYLPAGRRISRSMLWYSTNSIPIQNKQTRAEFDSEHFRLENIDSHYVWTEKHKKYLMLYNPDASIFNVGSILFRARRENTKLRPLSQDSIVIFDVTPFNGLGVEVFYTLKILTDFIEDIISVLNSREITNDIYLKPKREYRRNSGKGISPSTTYIDLIDLLQRDKKLKILKPNGNLYEIIEGALLVIGIPFTSPVILAKELKVESIYYIPDSARDWIIGSDEDGIRVVQGKKELLKYIQNLIL